MKKIILITCSILITIILSTTHYQSIANIPNQAQYTAYKSNFTLEIDERDNLRFNYPLVIIHDTAYVALKEISENFEKKVQWLPEQKKIRVIDMNKDISKIRIPFFDEEKRKYGYKDGNGTVVIEPKYDYVSTFKEGRAVAGCYNIDGLRKYGFIDDRGEVVIPIIYDNADDFYNGMAIVLADGYTEDAGEYYIRHDGSLLFDKKYLEANRFYEGYACIMTQRDYSDPHKKNEKWSFIDMSGNRVSDLEFDKKANFENGYANVILDGVEGYIDTSFNFIEGKR